VSYGFWRTRLGGAPKVIGTTIPINGTPTRVIGILPQSFEMPNLVRADLVVPQAIFLRRHQSSAGQSFGRPLRVFGRLKPDVTIAQAFSQLQPYFRQELNIVPPGFRKSVRPILRSLRDYQIKNVKVAAWLLFGGTLVILFIVCSNVASLLLARSVARARELAVRSALGAGGWRLRRQIFTESWLLSVLGGAIGCVFAPVLLHTFKTLAPASIPHIQQAGIDGRILLFALAMTLACGTLFGLAPAFHSPRPAMLAGRTGIGNSGTSLRHLLVTVQIALSLVLLSVAGLLLDSLRKLESVAPGISTTHVLTADISLSPHRYLNSASRQQFFDNLMNRLRSLPGITAVAVSDTAPPSGFVHSRPISALEVPGRPRLLLGSNGMVDWRSVTPEYFKALGIPILRGLEFREQDRASKSTEFILSATLSRRLFEDENPIGKVIKLALGPQSSIDARVVGIAADVKNNGLTGKSDPEYYVLRSKVDDPNVGRNEGLTDLSLHVYDGHAIVIIRTVLQPRVAAKWIRSETAALDPTTPVMVRTMAAQVRALSERPRFDALLLSAFALVGLLLASAGLYGLVSYLVVQRRQEIGVRMAVGATPRQIGSLILMHALCWTAAGIAVGLLTTLITTRFLGSLLFEVSPEDSLLFSAAALTLLAVSIVATLLPALRASRIDPMTVLRQE
jgi:predicted permease